MNELNELNADTPHSHTYTHTPAQMAPNNANATRIFGEVFIFVTIIKVLDVGCAF